MTVAMIMSVIMARIVLVSVSVIVRIALRLGLNGPVGHVARGYPAQRRAPNP